MTSVSEGVDDTSKVSSKTTTTVAMDFGTYQLDHDTRLLLFGTHYRQKLDWTDDALDAAGELSDHFADGPLVVGPTVPHLFAAGRSARAAISGYAAAVNEARALVERALTAK